MNDAPPTDITPDRDLEDRLRTMLARRAGDITDAELDPALPEGVRIALVDETGGARRRPLGWLSAAAIVVVLAVAVALVTNGDDPSDGVSTATSPSAPTPPPAADRPAHLSSLPLGVDPTTGPVRGIGAWGATPEAAADELMIEAYGEGGSTPNAPFEFPGSDPDGLWAAYRASTVELDPTSWPMADDAGALIGTVTVRRDGAGGWTAVAATNEALDLTGISYDAADGGLRGEVRATQPAPLKVTLWSTAGEELGTADLTTHAESGSTPSVLRLDEVLAQTDGRPVILQVTAGDRPGQVGLDGVRVAAFASVVLPGWADGETPPTATTGPPETTGPLSPADDPDRTETTITAPLPVEGGAGLAPGEGVLWRASVADWGDDPSAAAEAFAWAALGVPDVEVIPAPDPGPRDDLAFVEPRIVLAGNEVPVRLRRDGDAWIVLQVGDGSIERDGAGTTLSYDDSDLMAGLIDRVAVFHATVVQPDGSWQRDDQPGIGPHLVGASGAILLFVDTDGTVIWADGNAFG